MEPEKRGSSAGSADAYAKRSSNEALGPQPLDHAVPANRAEASALIANPLVGLSPNELAAKAESYCQEVGFTDPDVIRAFRLGAQVAGNVEGFESVEGLTDAEREAMRLEITHPWKSNPKTLYGVIVVCSLCAAVQGMDETVINGAQSIYKEFFGIGGTGERETWLLGLTNGAPYLCCAVIACWITDPMNKKFGRRGTVFIACVISFLTCFWQAFTNTWWHMFIARFFLGFGVGPKSATTPMFAAECAPPKLRGALVMQWQMWTAFGIMVGYIADLAFYFVPDHGIVGGLNWRLMMGSAGLPAIIVCAMIPFYPESPRWYLTKNRHDKAFESMKRLRFEKVQAARDLFYAHTLLEAERVAMSIGKRNRWLEMFTVRRNRNAVISSEIVMFMQQFCGVNVLAYYSSEIFIQANFGMIPALAASLGWGTLNFLMAIPAIFTIDKFGRRNLLLVTFPFLAIFMLFTGFSFWIPEGSTARLACVVLGMYLFSIAYSPGEGPVPFTYSAEAYPLYIRPIGMSLATATLWLFNFILSVTWPSMLVAFKPQGAFGWYAAWNVIGWFLVLFFLPETKERTLEELDQVFSVPMKRHAAYGWKQLIWLIHRYILFQKVDPPKVPHADDFEASEREYAHEKGLGQPAHAHA